MLAEVKASSHFLPEHDIQNGKVRQRTGKGGHSFGLTAVRNHVIALALEGLSIICLQPGIIFNKSDAVGHDGLRSLELNVLRYLRRGKCVHRRRGRSGVTTMHCNLQQGVPLFFSA